jgi:TatD DNase family protein
MNAPLIDTHCHLDFDSFDADRDEVLARALAAGVMAIVVPALDLGNLDAVLALADSHSAVFAAVGVHPNSTADWSDDWLDTLRAAARHPKVVAIGEIGLDYHWDKSPAAVQRRALEGQLSLAAELDLPVIIHNREATADVLDALGNSALTGRERAGVLHSFSADWAAAEIALGLGFHVGITGPVTFKKAEELQQIARRLPLDRLLIETDAPFLTPHPHRGQRNEPGYVRYVAEAIAALRDVPPESIAQQTTTNAERLFRLPSRPQAPVVE